jgi:hypothetical protein
MLGHEVMLFSMMMEIFRCPQAATKNLEGRVGKYAKLEEPTSRTSRW